MELVQITVEQILIMCVIMIVGVFCFRTGLVTKEKSKVLSDLLINIVTPALMVSSFQRDIDQSLIQNFLYSILLGAISIIISLVLARVLIRKSEKFDYVIGRFAATWSNCGFIGIPLANGIFGLNGVFYMVGFNIVFNLVVFTYGIYSVQQVKKRFSIRNMITPQTIAIVIGIALFALQLRLPKVLAEPLELLSSANTPLGVLIAGVSIAQTDIRSLLKNIQLYWISIIRVIIVPLMFILVCWPFGFPQEVFRVMLLATACPSATMGIIFAIQYGRDDNLVSQIFSITTLLSIITIPLVMALAAALGM